MSLTEYIVDSLLQESPNLETLKKHKVALTPDEKRSFKECSQDQSATAMKSVVNGKTWYACYTHRACQVSPTLKGALKAYPEIAATG
jgi:hypothetical protein